MCALSVLFGTRTQDARTEVLRILSTYTVLIIVVISDFHNDIFRIRGRRCKPLATAIRASEPDSGYDPIPLKRRLTNTETLTLLQEKQHMEAT